MEENNTREFTKPSWLSLPFGGSRAKWADSMRALRRAPAPRGRRLASLASAYNTHTTQGPGSHSGFLSATAVTPVEHPKMSE